MADPGQGTAQLTHGTNQMVGTLVMMTLAFGCWVVAAVNLGESRLWFFAAMAAVLTLAGLALMRPSSSTDPVSDS